MGTSGSYKKPEVDPKLLEQNEDFENPSGFIDNKNIDVAYDSSTRKITLTHSSGSIYYYWQGEKTELSSPWVSDAHADTAGAKFLSSTDGVNFTWSDITWSFSDIQVAYVADGKIFSTREVHGVQDQNTHLEFHTLLGTFRFSGFGLTDGTYQLQPSSPVDADNTPGFASGVIADEDLQSTLSAWAEGTYSVLYFTASGTINFDLTATSLLRVTGTYPNVNEVSGGTFSEVEASTGEYLNYYVIRIPVSSDTESQKYRAVVLQPQVAHSSLEEARQESINELDLGDFSSLSPEFVLVEKITFRTNASYSGATGRVRIEETSILVGSKAAQVSVTGSAISKYTDLTDTDSSYVSKALYIARVNAGETGVELVDPDSLSFTPSTHDLAGSEHNSDTLANLNTKISDATLDDSSSSRTPSAHDLAGSEHNSDTLSNLNTKISDATLDDSSDTRDPNSHASSHQNGGGDEISVAGLSGELADDQPPKAHTLGGAAHSADTLSNLNTKISDATLDDSSDTRDPNSHASSHQNGGGDEISVAGLSGELADNQPPKAHNLAGSDHNSDTLSNLNSKVSDATLASIDGTETLTNKTLTASSNKIGGVTMELGSDADADIYYRSGNVLTRLAKGTARQTLRMNSGATAPEYISMILPVGIAASDEETDLTTGTAKATFRMPFAMTLTEVRASVTTAPTGSVLTVDINETGSTILSTKITIDVSEKTSKTAATPPVISDSSLADDAEITIDIDTIGSTVAGAGLKVQLIGYIT